MKITEYPQKDFFGGHLDCIRFESTTPSTKELIFHPGLVEMGIGDGSQLYELYKYGFPKMAKAGYEFPFNITAIQPAKNYNQIGGLFPWMVMEYKPSSIITIGISLGAIQCLKALMSDPYKLVKGVVSLSGKWGTADIPKMENIPGYAFHGMSDTDVPFSQAKAFYDAYNAVNFPGFVTEYVSNLGHTGWDGAMRADGPLLKWIIQQFGPEPAPNASFEDGKQYVKQLVQNTISNI